MQNQIVVLDGSKFSDIEGFYTEIYLLLTSDLDWEVAHNFDALHDILFGGFGVFEPNQAFTIQWKHFSKNQKDLGTQHSVEYYKLRASNLAGKRSMYFLKKATDLEEGKGTTLMETILEIFTDHSQINLITEN